MSLITKICTVAENDFMFSSILRKNCADNFKDFATKSLMLPEYIGTVSYHATFDVHSQLHCKARRERMCRPNSIDNHVYRRIIRYIL